MDVTPSLGYILARFETHAVLFLAAEDRWTDDARMARVVETRYVADAMLRRVKADAALPYPRALQHLKEPLIAISLRPAP